MDRILLIEDDPSSQVLFRNRLEDLGHEVVVASTGAMGLMEARAGGFDLFLVDIGLGSGIDGFDVCRRLKGTPEIRSIPVVLISGQVKTREDLHRGYEAGCESFLVKGDVTLLEDVVRAMLRIKSLQDELSLQNRLLGEQNQRLQEERRRQDDLRSALRDFGSRATVFEELATGRPDGVLHVDSEGVIRFHDRGARDIFGKDLDGAHLGSVAQDTGMEAFVRNVRTDAQEARFDLAGRGGRVRSIHVSVVPMVPRPGSAEPLYKTVSLLDNSKRQVAAEMLRLEEQGIPRREVGMLMEAARRVYHPSAILGSSEAMNDLRLAVTRLTSTDRPVLLSGESGTGKGLIARTLHYGGLISGPFVPVHCSAIAPSLIESELFGHVKGAFPEAVSDRPGLFQQAQHGTLFLQEVQALPLAIQRKIVECLVQDEVCRVGSNSPEHVQVRLIASTSEDLEALVAEGRFDSELYQRLSAAHIKPEPLREREDDIGPLAMHFLHRFASARPEVRFADEAIGALYAYSWPGNVQELENCVERACALMEGDEIGVRHLPPALQELHRQDTNATIAAFQPGTPAHQPTSRKAAPQFEHEDFDEKAQPVSLQLYEKKAILRALQECDGDRLAAAQRLGIGKSTLYRKLKVHGI